MKELFHRSFLLGLMLACYLPTDPAAALAPPADAVLRPVEPVMACAALQAVDLADVADQPTHITRAAEVRAGQAHPYCRVEGYVAPKVRFEVQLPLSGWTQRYLQTGCGGLCGSLDVHLDEHTAGCVPAAHGELVLASSDMGHEGGGDGSWAVRDPQSRIDFGYRGMHVTALVAKALIAKFYGQGPRYSYFSGCSDGGREALVEAERYPDDFNGISAGAPALNFTVQNSFYHGWNGVANLDAAGRPILLSARLPILHDAALNACDAADGLKDGLIEDPSRCKFDPAVVQCIPGQKESTCLTVAEVEAARRIYAGAHDVAGRRLVVGGPMPGSELAWAGVIVPDSADGQAFGGMVTTGSVKNLYYPDALPRGWTYRDLKFDEATLDSFKLRAIYDATNPDLSRFRKAGGRLIIWHGWSDPHISPLNSIAYYGAVQRLLGADTTAGFLRLFVLPGMYHCGGGDGLFQFDVLTPLMAWVEGGNPPEKLLASHDTTPDTHGRPGPPPKPGIIDRTRPVFAYPKLAQYTGNGSIDDAASFVAVDPAGPALRLDDWLGAKYMVPGLQQVCQVSGKSLQCAVAP